MFNILEINSLYCGGCWGLFRSGSCWNRYQWCYFYQWGCCRVLYHLLLATYHSRQMCLLELYQEFFVWEIGNRRVCLWNTKIYNLWKQYKIKFVDIKWKFFNERFRNLKFKNKWLWGFLKQCSYFRILWMWCQTSISSIHYFRCVDDAWNACKRNFCNVWRIFISISLIFILYKIRHKIKHYQTVWIFTFKEMMQQFSPNNHKYDFNWAHY